MKNISKKLFTCISLMLSITIIFSIGSVFASDPIQNDTNVTIITDPEEMQMYLSTDTVNPEQNFRMQRHQELLNDGYVLEAIYIENSIPNNRATLSTQISISRYGQPTKEEKEYANKLWDNVNKVANNSAVVFICGNLPFKVIPTVIGLTRDIYNAFGGSNYVETTTDSTLFIKQIDVIDNGKRYAVGMAERLTSSVTWLHSGYTASGDNLHKSKSNNFEYTSSNYNNDTYLSNKAKDVHVNGNSAGLHYFTENYLVSTKTLY